VFIGIYNDEPEINPEEVDDWKWVDVDELERDMQANPDTYTVWFRIAFKEMKNRGMLV
jgi:isopentenyl-diphosphate delta-isomerase